MTAISGVLKPLATKALRRARIAEEARLISVPQALYLPTSPAWQVEAILVRGLSIFLACARHLQSVLSVARHC